MKNGENKRCEWVGIDPLMILYHDTEWGIPLHSDRKLFELLILEGAQAGLSWMTVLKKRQNYRKAFNKFDAIIISRYTKRDIKRLLNDEGIIRNRLKIESTIQNAKIFLEIKKEFGSFDKYIWQFVGHVPIRNKFKSVKQIPPYTKESDVLSKDLKSRGFKFVGTTICYAFMQSAGLVNDHTVDCFRHKEVQKK